MLLPLISDYDSFIFENDAIIELLAGLSTFCGFAIILLLVAVAILYIIGNKKEIISRILKVTGIVVLLIVLMSILAIWRGFVLTDVL